MITEATPEQWEQLYALRDQVIAAQTDEITLEDATAAVAAIWKRMGHEAPTVELYDSPRSAYHAIPEDDAHQYLTMWWRSWMPRYTAAKILGATFDEEVLQDLQNWVDNVPFIRYTEDKKRVAVSRNPIEIHWNEDGLLHNESGPSLLYADGFAVYSIDGVRVSSPNVQKGVNIPEEVDVRSQIVMAPETQTIEQINAETNEEVRRIRIDRFGWNRYIEETGSSLIDSRRNDIENTVEMLVDTPVGKRLLAMCPSTGRKYSLGLPDGAEVETCEDAQKRLWGDRDNVRIIGRT